MKNQANMIFFLYLITLKQNIMCSNGHTFQKEKTLIYFSVHLYDASTADIQNYISNFLTNIYTQNI